MDALVLQADSLLAMNCYKDAVEKYIYIANKWPSMKHIVRDHLLIAVSHLMDQLSLKENNDLEDSQFLMWLFHSVCSLFGDNPNAMTMLGVKCLDESLYEQAEFLLKRALQSQPDFLGAKENLRVLFDRVVNRWHFHMLNDIHRNSSYFRAIHSAVRSIPDCTVLDIGSGTGILRYQMLT